MKATNNILRKISKTLHVKVLKSCLDLIDFKRDILDEYTTKVLKGHPSFLRFLEEYENYIVKVLGKYGLTVIQSASLNIEEVFKHWEMYVSKNFSPDVEFEVDVLERYMYLFLYS